jgi:hypothetical protein
LLSKPENRYNDDDIKEKKTKENNRMANQQDVERFLAGEDAWKTWRSKHPGVEIDLNYVDFRGADLMGADLHRTNLIEANLSNTNLMGAYLLGANLSGADLSGADLMGADLSSAILSGADLTRANLSSAILRDADLTRANLSGADLSDAILSRARLVGTNLAKATLTQCSVYGISAWNVQLDGAKQENIVITNHDEPMITVDYFEMAQFIYLLLNNTKIREVIDTIAKKAVLILGCFTPGRRTFLDALRDALRTNGYVPILLDFEKPSSRNFTERVRTLAHLSRFIIADLTNSASLAQELSTIVPTLAVPIQPLLEASQKEDSLFDDLKRTYHWVLPTYCYSTLKTLLPSLKTDILEPAERKVQELEKR